jgi:hypothetical protein
MPITVELSDDEVVGFSNQAKNELAAGIRKFAVDLVSEANRLESERRGAAGGPDVSANDIRDALPIVRRREPANKAGLRTRAIRVGSAACALLLGIIWDRDSLHSSTYLAVVAGLFAVTLLLVILAALED